MKIPSIAFAGENGDMVYINSFILKNTPFVIQVTRTSNTCCLLNSGHTECHHFIVVKILLVIILK